MSHVKEIMEMHKGELIPAWLMYMDPKDKFSVRGTATFATDGIIIEYNDVFWFIPKTMHIDNFIKISGSINNAIGANFKTIILPIRTMSMNIREII